MVRIRNATRNTVLAEAVEVADTSRKRRRGLLKRESLAAGQGLWISPCEAIHTIGMRFAIDVLFLDRSRKVMKMRKEMRPGKLAVCLRAHSVLELPAGVSEATQTVTGDQLQFEKAL